MTSTRENQEETEALLTRHGIKEEDFEDEETTSEMKGRVGTTKKFYEVPNAVRVYPPLLPHRTRARLILRRGGVHHQTNTRV